MASRDIYVPVDYTVKEDEGKKNVDFTERGTDFTGRCKGFNPTDPLRLAEIGENGNDHPGLVIAQEGSSGQPIYECYQPDADEDEWPLPGEIVHGRGINPMTNLPLSAVGKNRLRQVMGLPVLFVAKVLYTTAGESATVAFEELGSHSRKLEYAVVKIYPGPTSLYRAIFRQCRWLTNVEIPEGVTTIGDSAFAECRSLGYVTLPRSVTTIGQGAFRGCTSLESVVIPGGVTTIRVEAFRGCTSLTSVKIPEGVTEIAQGAFRECTSLASVVIPKGVTTIGEEAFCNCASLTSVTIPGGVKTIEYRAFYGCTSLTSVTIPEGVTKIEAYTFYGCTSLAFAIVPDELVTSTGAFPPNTKVMGSGSMETDEGRRVGSGDAKREAVDDDDDDEYRNAWAGMRSRNPARLPRGAGMAKRARTSGLLVDWTREETGKLT